MRLSLLFFGLILMFSACRAPSDEQSQIEPLPYHLVGYVGGNPNEVEATKLTHINYAFANLTPQGEIIEGHPSDSANLAALVALKAQNPHLKILVSVGGWSWSDYFSDAALTPDSRTRFVNSAVNFLRKHQLDGIDLDWEYPGQRGEGNVFRPEDKHNFTVLLRMLRERLDGLAQLEGRDSTDRYLLTIATQASPVYFEHTEMDIAHHFLDFINVMSYDYSGAWSEKTAHHTNLFSSSIDPSFTKNNTAKAIEEHIEAGIPPEKLVVGVAFYGRAFGGVHPKKNGLHQPFDRALPSLKFDSLHRELIDQHGFARFWDEQARAPYLWNETDSIFISYDDEASLELKAKYVKDMGLGGIMFWRYDQDHQGLLLNTLYETLKD